MFYVLVLVPHGDSSNSTERLSLLCLKTDYFLFPADLVIRA